MSCEINAKYLILYFTVNLEKYWMHNMAEVWLWEENQ